MNTDLQHTKTYHLDQNVRGFVSTKNEKLIGKLIKDRVSERYCPEKHEAILPFALLEYAGVKQQCILKQINIPPSVVTSRPIDVVGIKVFLENELKQKLPENTIDEKLKDKLHNSKKTGYAKPFVEQCISDLPKMYKLIIGQLSWDRFSQMSWENHISDKVYIKDIRWKMAEILSKEPHLYALRHVRHLCPLLKERYEDESNEIGYFMKIVKGMKLDPNKDLGDCELIHIAIHGQPSENFQNIRVVDCYTMDNSKDIKRRLVACLFFYRVLNDSFNNHLTLPYSGKVYIIDQQTGEELEGINMKDYLPNEVLYKIKIKDTETLDLLK